MKMPAIKRKPRDKSKKESQHKPKDSIEETGSRTDSHVLGSSDEGSSGRSDFKTGFLKFIKRLIILIAAGLLAYAFSTKGGTGVTWCSTQFSPRMSFQVKCSNDYDNETWKGCLPRRCGRVVMDNLLPEKEVDTLLRFARKGLALGGSNGGASIMDLHSGALSKGDVYVDVFRLPEAENIFTEEDFKTFRKVKDKILVRLSMEFGPMPNTLSLTHPTFFSRMNSKPAKTIHDEYWHLHVDKETYKTFHYTSLVYLGTYGVDFTGGRFMFVDKDTNRTVEPRKGRVSMFTSGSENPHLVEKVSSGERYALTVSFTCDPNSAIMDPELRKVSKGR